MKTWPMTLVRMTATPWRAWAMPSTAAQVVEDAYELRLTALLHQLVRRRGHKGAARELGVNLRTVAGSVKQGMSRRVREALEQMLVDRDGEARDRLEDDMERVKVEVAGVNERVAGLESELREGLQALEEQQAQGMRRLERGLAQAEAGKGGGDAGPTPRSIPAPGSGSPSRRRYPELVTTAPAGDDEEVYGDAWPLVGEWRRLWDGHPAQGKGLAWVSRRERILELEVAMLEDHGLTLPPETEPLRGLDRGAEAELASEGATRVQEAPGQAGTAAPAAVGVVVWAVAEVVPRSRWRGSSGRLVNPRKIPSKPRQVIGAALPRNPCGGPAGAGY